MYFAPFGQKFEVAKGQWSALAQSNAAITLNNLNDVTNRGYTGHEHIDAFELIHMNGRIFDPVTARFIQADPMVQEAKNSQNLNRYTYVLNNPLGYTDPSGYFFLGLRDEVKPYISTIVTAGLVLATGGTGSWFVASWYGAATAGAIGGAIGAAVNGGNIFKAAAIGAFSGAVFHGIGAAYTGAAEGGVAHILAHATAGGVISLLQGGSFGHGFISAGLTKALHVNGLLPGIGGGLDTARIALAAIIGGTISELTGGKFANGAITAAYGQAFNGNSFWDGVEAAGKIAVELSPVGSLATCYNDSCSYLEWTVAVIEIAPPAKLFKLARKAVAGSGEALNKLRNLFKPSSCFVAGTIVQTIDGPKPIEDIEVGDLVASKNDQTGETDFKPVVQLFNFTDKVVINLTFETRQGDEELIQATPEHPFMLKNGQWMSAGQLTPGDFIKTAEYKVVRLKSVATDAKTQEVFNFEVADFHTYFVGDNGLWVHNADCGGLDNVDPHSLERTHSLSGKTSSKIVDKTAQSMRQDGYLGGGIDVVEHQGKRYVIDGHHRLAAAKRTGTNVKVNIIKDIPNHHSDFNTIQDVIKSNEFVGLDNLRPPRRR